MKVSSVEQTCLNVEMYAVKKTQLFFYVRSPIWSNCRDSLFTNKVNVVLVKTGGKIRAKMCCRLKSG